jgi:2-keto-4-pentenoate hydratase/2-oxohepta-3-ene-1,7-dioic acid hydratase in catechol pathway
MKIIRFVDPDSAIRWGALVGEAIDIIDGDILGQWNKTARRLALGDVTLLAPIVPANILCIGRNYKAHAAEGGADVPKAPLLFIKATSCLNDPGGQIVLPAPAPAHVDFEAELAVVIAKAAWHVSEADALGYVLGYTCANDVSARDTQSGDGQWARAKSFDTFGPMGPWIETNFDPRDVEVTGRLNGQVMQRARTSDMIFSVAHLISYLSRGMTLLPGTVLLTGTPAGCGFARKPPVWLRPGDVYEVEIEGIGTLKNSVAEE